MAQSTQDMANLETILRELRDFRRENTDTLKEIKDELRALELQKQFENRLVDQEGRSRRENIRIHGVKEGAEDSARSMIDFTETLLQEKLELPPSLHLRIERAHHALASRPPLDSPPRSIVVRFMSFRNKEEIIKIAWQKRIKNQYGLNNQDLYRYLQMRHYMEQTIKKFNPDELQSGIIKLFISAYESDLGKKLITKLYKEVENLKGNNTTYIKENWGNEAGRELSEEEREKVNEGQWKTTCSL